MSETDTPKPTEAEEAVRGGLFAALGGFEDTSTPKDQDDGSPSADPPTDPQAQPSATASDYEIDTSGSIATDDPKDAPADTGVKLSAKDLRVKKRTSEKSVIPTEQPAEKTIPKEDLKPLKEEKPAKPDYSKFANRERETLELLEFGEQKELADKGIASKVAKYYEDRSKLIEDLRSENYDDEDYDPQQDHKYRQWAKNNRPPIDVDKLETIRKEQWIDDAKQRALDEIRAERDEHDKKWKQYIEEQEREKLRPEVEREVSTFSDSLLSQLDPEVTKAFAEQKDWAKVEESMPIEAPIVRQVLNEYTDKAEVLMGIASGVTKLDPRNPTHSSLQRFISSQADYFIKNGKTERGGKQFAHPKEFKDPNTQWTFGKEDMVNMLSKAAKIVAEKRIAAEKNKFQSMLKRQGLSAQEASDASDGSGSGTSVKPSASGGSNKGAAPKRRSLMDFLG